MKETLIESTANLYHDALETMIKKNSDYAGDSKSMKNFRISAETANIKMSQGILSRLVDKTTRIGNLLQKQAKVKDESIFDTIQDLINYSAILLYAVKLEQEEERIKSDPQLSIFEPQVVDYVTSTTVKQSTT